MKISELLQTLENISQEYKTSTPYIVGGLPRDREFGIVNDIKDIDITTGDENSFGLCMAASRIWPNAHFRTYNDGHSSLDFKDMRIDFSNNFNIPMVGEILEKNKIIDPTSLEKEMYSRDFTINTLLQPMDLNKKPLDITGKAFDDIKNKVLRTPIDPEFTIGYDPRRILRAIKLILKFNLTVEEDLEKAIIKYRGSINELSILHVKKQVNQILEIDSRKALELFFKYKLLPILPLSKMLSSEVVKNKMVQNLLDG